MNPLYPAITRATVEQTHSRPVRSLHFEVRRCVLILLPLLYLTFSTHMLVTQLHMPVVGTGSVAFNVSSDDNAQSHARIWKIRRHIPPAKLIFVALPLAGYMPRKFAQEHQVSTVIPFHFPLFNAFYFSVLSDKAPPQS